jgi:uncharacterized protein YaiL (DUF2058 family)
MQNLEEKKKKLEQKKARMQLEETRLKLTERKARTRHLIEMGGLVTKAGLDDLPTNALYGALLSIKKDLDTNENLVSGWIVKGALFGRVHLLTIWTKLSHFHGITLTK